MKNGGAQSYFREFLRNNGSSLSISQFEVGDVGCVVWDAAIVLSYYLDSQEFVEQHGNNILKGKKVVELGSGTGLVGILAAANGAQCIITDLPEFLTLMQMNIGNNSKHISGSIEARELVWGSKIDEFLQSPDYILLSDCIYYEESLDPLINTIIELSDINTIVLCCYEKRTTGNKPELERRFFEKLKENFDMELVPQENQDPVYSSDDIKIVKMWKRSPR